MCIVVVSVTGKELENVGLDVLCAVLGLGRGIMQRLSQHHLGAAAFNPKEQFSRAGVQAEPDAGHHRVYQR